MKRILTAAILTVLTGVFIFVLAGRFHSPSFDEVTGFVGKTEEELREQVGPPRNVAFIESAVVPPPKGCEDDPAQREAWIDWQFNHVSDHTLEYGTIRVDVNVRHQILRVYHHPSRPLETSLRTPTEEELAEYCGKTEMELVQAFGWPQNAKFLSPVLPAGISDAEREDFKERTPARELTYGRTVVVVNGNGRVISVSH